MLTQLAFAALANGALLGVVIVMRAIAGRNRTAALLGALTLVAAGAGAVILAGRLEGGIVEIVLILLTGPLLFALICHLVRPPAPWAVLVVAVLVEASVLIATLHAEGFDPIAFAVLCQIGFTLAGWWVYAHQRAPASTDRRTRTATGARAALAILLALSLVHGAQLLRIAFPHIAWLRPIVPVAIAAALFGLSLHAVIRLLTPSALSSLLPDRGSTDTADALLGRLREALEAGGAFGDPELRLEAAAAMIDETPAAITRAAGDKGFSGFRGFLQRLRIEQAMHQLADPAERRTSIDAIGLGCGFRSRSAFYEAFRRETGQAPGVFREAANRQMMS